MALNAPFVMKISYYLPSEENQKKNAAHINYINRAGAVDYGAMEPENQESVEIARQEMERDELIHLQYMHERPRSSGLFGENGNLDIDETKRMLSNHEGIVWRCIVSLREDDAIRLDRIERSKWEDSLKASFAEIQDKLGIPASNFRWTAAYHPEPGHPHCHLLFWEENSVRTKGTLSQGEMTDLRKAFVKNICTRDREQLLMEKEYYRNAMRNGVRDLMGLKKNLEQDSASLQARLGGRPGITPKLYPEQEQYLHNRLEHLSAIMPGHGRVAFDYMPEAVKQEAGEMADWIMTQPDFIKAKDLYLQANLDIVNMYMRDQPEEIKQAMERAYNDLRKRLAQDVLKAAAQFPGRQEPPQPEMEHDPPYAAEDIPCPADVDIPCNEVNIPSFTDDIDFLVADTSPDKSKEGINAEKEATEWFRESFRLLERQNGISEYQSIPELDYPKFGNELIKLRDLIPEEFDGRVVMAYLPEALKQDTRKVADKLLNTPQTKHLQNLSNMNFIRDRIAENALSHAVRLQNKEIPDIKMILHPRRAIEITERLMTAKPDLIMGNTEELEWTAAKMHEAFSKTGVLPQHDVEQFMASWEQNAGLNVNAVNSLVNKNRAITDKRKMDFISKSDWSRLRDNLGCEEHELLIPWMGQIKKVPEDPGKEKQELKNIVPQILDLDKVPDAIQFFEKATNDSELLKDIKELKWTIWTSSWVLEELGLNEQERFDIISSWTERSGVNISRARIADIIDRPTLSKDKNDEQEGEKAKRFLGKDNWTRLTNNLCPVLDTPERPWVPDKEGNISMEWFRSSFRLIEREQHAIDGGKRIELPNFKSWKSGVEQLKAIIPYIPDEFDGRAVIAYLPEELKAKVQGTADWLLAREDIQEPLQKHLQIIQPDTSKAYQMIRDRIAEAALQRALQMQGKEIPKVNMILHARRANEVTERLISAKTDLVRGDENEAKWTAGKIHEALSKIGVLPPAEINQVVTAWATDAGLSEDIIKEILSKDYSGENELDFIGKGSWSRLRDNLGYGEHELLTPWMGQMEKKPQEETQAQSQKPIPPPTFHTELVPGIIETFKTVTAQPILLKNIDELKWTIWTSSWVLKEFGLDEQERFDVIARWTERSGVNISNARIADIIDRSNLQPAVDNDSPRWLGKDNWNRLMNNLGTDKIPERPWQYLDRFNLIGSIWKGAWQSLQREKSKTEHQARVLQAQREYEEKEQKRREGRDR